METLFLARLQILVGNEVVYFKTTMLLLGNRHIPEVCEISGMQPYRIT